MNFQEESSLRMQQNIPNKMANVNNPLARELIEAREKMRQRTQIEALKPLYKNRSNRWTVVAIFTLWLGTKFYNTANGTKLHKTLCEDDE